MLLEVGEKTQYWIYTFSVITFHVRVCSNGYVGWIHIFEYQRRHNQIRGHRLLLAIEGHHYYQILIHYAHRTSTIQLSNKCEV